MRTIVLPICPARTGLWISLALLQVIVEPFFIHLGLELTDLFLKASRPFKIRVWTIQQGVQLSGFSADLIPRFSSISVKRFVTLILSTPCIRILVSMCPPIPRPRANTGMASEVIKTPIAKVIPNFFILSLLS
jgi:hypothetical protein